MILKGIILLSGVALAQSGGPEYTGTIQQKLSPQEQRVNEHMLKTGKKIEIEGAKKETELRKQAPKDLHAEPIPKKKTPFLVHPKKENPQDPNAFRDQYDHNLGKDPSTEFEQQVIDSRNEPTPEMTNEEFVRQFKENAARAGVKVNVDSNYKAKPVGNPKANANGSR